MYRRDFFYELPAELIAQQPLESRTGSRLLHLERSSGEFHDRTFSELPALLFPGDLLVLNETQVVKARLIATKKTTGGRVEVLLERLLDKQRMVAQLKASKPVKPGAELSLPDGPEITVTARMEDGFYELQLQGEHSMLQVLEKFGRTPLPPYIRRSERDFDQDRYQTVYARNPGAVAAPTAGLHFDEGLLERCTERGIEIAYLTLHVGAGTFLPVRTESVEEHKMHSEAYSVPAALCEEIRRVRANKGRIVACGTTVVRALETAAARSPLQAQSGETKIFIYPGYRFRLVDAMITNFHLPESTLLMLVAAFAGTDSILRAYRHAVDSRYRFFSYGDAMLIS